MVRLSVQVNQVLPVRSAEVAGSAEFDRLLRSVLGNQLTRFHQEVQAFGVADPSKESNNKRFLLRAVDDGIDPFKTQPMGDHVDLPAVHTQIVRHKVGVVGVERGEGSHLRGTFTQ